MQKQLAPWQPSSRQLPSPNRRNIRRPQLYSGWLGPEPYRRTTAQVSRYPLYHGQLPAFSKQGPRVFLMLGSKHNAPLASVLHSWTGACSSNGNSLLLILGSRAALPQSSSCVVRHALVVAGERRDYSNRVHSLQLHRRAWLL